MTDQTRRRPGLAAIVATLALVASLTGTSYAAGLITSKQIKNGTIRAKDLHAGAVTGKKVKDGSLGTADLAPDARPVGGAAYSQGHTGPVPIAGATPVTVVQLTIPEAGSYVIQAVTELYTESLVPLDAICRLETGSDYDQKVVAAPVGGVGTTPLQVTHVYPTAGLALLTCFSTDGGLATASRVVATKVRTLVNTAG